MPDKDPLSYELATYAWITVLTSVAGFISFLRKVREGISRPFNMIELIGEIVTSGFVGVLTFWLCEAGNLTPLLTAFLVGIAGHMGSRMIFLFEKCVEIRMKRYTDG